MKFFLHHYFHNETNDRSEKGKVFIPTDKSMWPENWTRIEYKQYTLFPPIKLEHQSGMLWDELLVDRRSDASSIANNVITIPALSYILKCGYGLQGGSQVERKENRTVPSGGKRYPLEIYVFLFQSLDCISEGIYHYGIKEHELQPLDISVISPETVASFSPVPCTQKARGAVVITGVFDRTVRKYGSRGYRYILLEAGHVAQNMILAGTEKKVNMVPIGGVNEQILENRMCLSTSDERILYTLYF